MSTTRITPVVETESSLPHALDEGDPETPWARISNAPEKAIAKNGKCLVLDLDGTLLDTYDDEGDEIVVRRPFLKEFVAYAFCRFESV